jgi:hypothetical protein
MTTKTITNGSEVTNAAGDWTGTVRIVRNDGTALVNWHTPMTAKSIDFPVADLRPMPANKSREVKAARRALNNFRAMVRRPSNWSGALQAGYASAFRSVVVVEDVYGIDAAAPLSDRLTALRLEAGLTADEVISAERYAMERADHDATIRARRAAV